MLRMIGILPVGNSKRRIMMVYLAIIRYGHVPNVLTGFKTGARASANSLEPLIGIVS